MAARRVCWRGRTRAAAARQQAEAVVQARRDLLERPAARMRAAASSSASGMPSSRRQICATAAAFSVGQREAGLAAPRPLDEQPHRLGLRPALAIGGSRPAAGQRQGRHPPDDLAGDAAALRGWWPACAAAGRPASSVVGQRRRRRPPGARSCPAPAAAAAARRASASVASSGCPGCSRTPSARGHRLRHQRRVGQRGQLHQPDPLREARRQVGGHLQRQAGLADAAGARQGHQPVRGQQRARPRRRLALAAHEAGQRRGRLVGGALGHGPPGRRATRLRAGAGFQG